MYRQPSSAKAQDNPLKKKTTKNSPKSSQSTKASQSSKTISSGGNEKSKSKLEIPTLKENGSPSEFINSAIHEYLVYKELNTTVDNFMNEIAYASNERKSPELNFESQFFEVFYLNEGDIIVLDV